MIVREYLNEVGIQRLVWPARRADLNVIEHVWDKLKRRIRRRDPTPENLAELENAASCGVASEQVGNERVGVLSESTTIFYTDFLDFFLY
ncbi:hypothetical protein D910_06601 [Dendroctonus ponderosae]|uniref:Tc1-like transposase DDE domain-containing protein n=1 Tax=Dendroctonus ponderosae TaxID=77166 RepID=U4U847_DENPD|nr:hypothetical protein D910_06601 [Dendroctonus ponderosae]